MRKFRRRTDGVRHALIFSTLGLLAWSPAIESKAEEREVSLRDLLDFAAQHAPEILVARESIEYGRAARVAAQPWLHQNPSLDFGIGPRVGAASEPTLDFYGALGVPIEIAGERSSRLTAADAHGQRFVAEASLVQWQVRRDVLIAYGSAVVARERAANAEQQLVFADEMVRIVRKRVAAGDVGMIELQVAEVDAAQAQQAKLLEEQALRSARIRLCEVTGWPVETAPQVHLRLEAPRAAPTLATALNLASRSHPELRLRQAAVLESTANVALADREAWPKPIVGVHVAREGTARDHSEYIVLGTIGVALPLWQTNQGERARARVDARVAQIEAELTTQRLRARIARAQSELQSAVDRISLFTSNIVPTIGDSLALLRRGFEAGEIPLLNVAVAREHFLQVQRAGLDAYADYYRSAAELESAIGAELPSTETNSTRGAR